MKILFWLHRGTKLDVKVRRGGGKTRRRRYEERNGEAAIVETECVLKGVRKK